MNVTLSFIRIFFICLSAFFLVTYTTAIASDGFNLINATIGLAAGIILALGCIAVDLLFRKSNLRVFNIVLIGLFFGYLMGQAVTLLLGSAFDLSSNAISAQTLALLKIGIYLFTSYIGMTLTARSAEDFSLILPFIKLKSSSNKNKDLVTDWTVLADTRIVDLATSGLLDGNLIIPRFMLKELYVMAENSDETIKCKAKRALDTFKRLETITALEMRYSDIDFPEIKDSSIKLMQLARHLDANIITADISRLQNYAIDGVRIINIHMLSNALKPINGETLNIKIQRYGKEPRQGVGYLEDGTMVVVNGGAEFIGDTIKAHVLSVKHTASGRMIFCNANDEFCSLDPSLSSMNLSQTASDLENNHKNYFSL